MQYAVIFTVDTDNYGWLELYAPPEDLGFVKTEGDEEFLPPDKYFKPEEWGWDKGHHGKWHAHLNEEEFKEFIEHCRLVCGQDEGTALGNIGYGFTEAVIFKGYDNDDVVSEAWVTPFCPDEELPDWLKENGERIPACLADSKGQRYLFRGVKDKRSKWRAVADCIAHVYG